MIKMTKKWTESQWPVVHYHWFSIYAIGVTEEEKEVRPEKFLTR